MISIARGVVALLLVAYASCAGAATTAERSPFVQGHWWDPTRSGHGFEILNAGGQVAVVWYTYDEGGQPIWYYAQGPLADLATRALPLVRTRWSEGRMAAPTSVGSLRLRVRHAEGIDVEWNLGANTGTWSIRPFVAAGVVSEVDHTGHWFDPSSSGWGFTLVEQGDVLGTVVYAYDTQGAPTWRAGFGRAAAQRRVDMYTYAGSCPYCAPRTTTNSPAGALTFDYRGEASLRVQGTLSLALPAGLRIDGADAVQLGRPASTRPADRQLATAESPDSLLTYLREGMLQIRSLSSSTGGSDFSPAPGGGGTTYSPTNLQEADVDEASLVKTDGRYIYALTPQSLDFAQAGIRIAEVSGEGAGLATRGLVAFAPTSDPVVNDGLFLDGNRLVSLRGSRPMVFPAWSLAPANGWQNGVVHVELFDRTQPTQPVSRWRASFDGYLLASRRIGSRLYLVLRHIPTIAGHVPSASPTQASRDAVRNAPLDAFLPKVRIDGGAPVVAMPTTAFHLPPQGSRQPTAEMTLVYEIDLGAPAISGRLGMMGSVETVYASVNAIYAATTRSALRDPVLGTVLPGEAPTVLTDIHRIVLSDGLRPGGSGSVEGFLAAQPDLAQFRLSEHGGRLRVVTSTSVGGWWGPDNRNRLTILEPSTQTPGLLKTVSYLPNPQRPQPLGLPRETLYATRFVGDRLYAITFGPTGTGVIDPLYVVDVSAPADPRIRGELVIPGFSEYLHPVAPGFLVGFGTNVTLDNIEVGLKVSLYDVRNDALPREVSSHTLGWRGSRSALQTHHHAFSALLGADGSGTVAFPVFATKAPVGPNNPITNTWEWSGVARYQLRRTGDGLALEPVQPLVAASLAQNPWLFNMTFAAGTNGRTVLFPNGSVFFTNGWFWNMDSAGRVTGPL